ncbi:MAG TPA: hypothetical protein VG891_03365 [Rhizomicrobium sp.]|nr:hypothetical protein [Rhizomicrobium sp.]
MPENMTETEIEISQPDDFPGMEAMLAEQLRRCHRATVSCFDFGENEAPYFAARAEAFKIAARLMKSSLDLANILRRGNGEEIRHRMIYEHTSPRRKNRQTNSGVEDGEARDG